jgi:multiple sugar transport system permease protein
MRRRTGRRIAAAVGHRVLVLGFTVFAVFPFYWMLVTAFKQNADLYVGASNTAHNPFIFNRAPTLDHLRILFGNTLYLTWLFNTLWVGALVVLITLLLGVPAAYSLARLAGRWGERMSIGIFLTYLPKEVEESVMVDGCRLGAVGRVVLPLAVPGLLTVVIFALTLTIQEFVYSLTFISSVGRMTVSVGAPVALVRGDVYYWAL